MRSAYSNGDFPPMGGSATSSCCRKVSVAFCPVVTMARQFGSCFSRRFISVGSTMSRNLSEALSCKRRTAEAVSYSAIPFSFRNFIMRSLSNDFFVRMQEIIFIRKKDYSENAPHVVLQVRVEKIHTPALFLWRKASQHQQYSVCRQERFQRVSFYGRNNLFSIHWASNQALGLGSFLASKTMLYTYSVIQLSE